MGDDYVATQNFSKERSDTKIKEPKMYNVIMLNDDFTTMEFVVRILVSIFHKDEISAHALMMTVHKNGKAVVGKYPYDIASTKIKNAIELAKQEGYPFRMKMEEA
ncbi:MAG: ATP-dependent Clp protease adaptor ClpS [Ruminococcus sp.]|nr:ATP-dependent Clp protease adaptor ClpS [Ruminococcus sp.]